MAPSMNAAGILDKRSNQSVDETLEKLKSTLQAKGVTLFGGISIIASTS